LSPRKKSPSSRGSSSRSSKKTVKDDASAYAIDVLEGRVLAGKPVRQACERHVQDWNSQKETGLKWRADLAQEAIEFFEEVLTVEVRNEVRPFTLEGFERFIVGSIFGWHNPDGTRRFRTAYVEIGKGGGKTPLAAGIGLYGLVADGEQSPEVYAAAVTAEQARICFRDAARMVERNSDLKQLLEERVSSIYYPGRGGVFRPVSSEHRGLDGKRVHIALIDELHEHMTDLVVEKMRAGTKARRNALIFEITNAGVEMTSVCWQHHEYSLKVLEGTFDDPAWFAYVCALDEGDDWMSDESCWIKANPGLGAILPIEYLREQVRTARGMPTKQAMVARLNFCQWVQQAVTWIPTEEWNSNSDPLDIPGLQG